MSGAHAAESLAAFRSKPGVSRAAAFFAVLSRPPCFTFTGMVASCTGRWSAPRLFALWLAAACVVLPGVGHGADISERLPSGLIAHADYRAGSPDRPAVMVLHGFMTTQNFSTIRTIVNELNESGYTVLAPTLTLGIDQRRGGLACGAIHTHTMSADLAEVSWWVDWLAAHHPGPLVLIGHSSGSLQSIAYAADKPSAQLRMVIATSPIYFGEDYPAALVAEQIAGATWQMHNGDAPLERYALTFCNHNFVATPESYLSYAAWGRQRVLDSVQHAQVPVKALFGSEDPRATAEWQQGLRVAGAAVTVIPGATHFFDATHEFELLDLIRDALRRVDDPQAGDQS